ncbi:hypothetical protein DFH09DRAFT_1366416 [Mycena vulgaris]|nr:hypothetical protein DFH09DRAFT_1366416 [Mycena vulgaris]
MAKLFIIGIRNQDSRSNGVSEDAGHVLVDVIRERGVAPPSASNAPPRWLGLPVIFDEVFVGFYRLGMQSTRSCFAPDISFDVKTLTGGLVPTPQSSAHFYGTDKRYGHSYNAHLLGCEVASETLCLAEKDYRSTAWAVAQARWEVTPGSWNTGCGNPDFAQIVSCINAEAEVMALGTAPAIKVMNFEAEYSRHDTLSVAAAISGLLQCSIPNLRYFLWPTLFLLGLRIRPCNLFPRIPKSGHGNPEAARRDVYDVFGYAGLAMVSITRKCFAGASCLWPFDPCYLTESLEWYKWDSADLVCAAILLRADSLPVLVRARQVRTSFNTWVASAQVSASLWIVIYVAWAQDQLSCPDSAGDAHDLAEHIIILSLIQDRKTAARAVVSIAVRVPAKFLRD